VEVPSLPFYFACGATGPNQRVDLAPDQGANGPTIPLKTRAKRVSLEIIQHSPLNLEADLHKPFQK